MAITNKSTVEDINRTTLSTQEHNALAILENISEAELNELKKLMDLGIPNVIGSTTLSHFLKFVEEHDLDLSEAGVNAFKDRHKLGNTGVVKGVIGAQTAGVYYEQLIHKVTPTISTDGVRQINRSGLHLIKEFEGLAKKIGKDRVVAYSDSVRVATIGYGHTKNVYLGMTISYQQAEEFLKQDLKVAESGVSSLVKVELNDNQFAALVSFVFNLGIAAFSHSTLLRDLNAKNYNAAAEQFLRWNHAGHKILPGLTRRRRAERQLFLS